MGASELSLMAVTLERGNGNRDRVLDLGVLWL